MDFKQWLIQIGKSEKTAKNYGQAINSSISQWAKDAGLIESSLNEIKSVCQLKPISEDIQQLDIFQKRNKKGKGMYSAALRQFSEYIDDVTGQVVSDDIEQILSDKAISTTEKSTLINTRIGQGQYRRDLIDYWGGCAVTGCSDPRFLVASHIKPWKDSVNDERLDRFNGLLLLPNLDKVFDLGYVSFKESGVILISKQLDNYPALGIIDNMSVLLSAEHQGYMAYHRECKFKSE